MSTRLTAAQRLARLLAVIPWVVEQGGASVDEIATRFSYPRDQLLADLRDVLFFVGVHPFTPDTLVDVEIADDRVRIRYADWFSRPLRLTPSEGARLLTAGRAVLAAEETTAEDPAAGPLVRALAKLGLALGDASDEAVEIRLGDAPEAVLSTLRRAIAVDRAVELEYYGYGRDEVTRRTVDPARVFTDQGNWYVSGWCHRAGGERVFRVDRIRSIAVTDEPRREVLGAEDGTSFTPSTDDPRVVLRLDPDAAWVTEQYPTEAVESTPDGLVVTLVVSGQAWLERLLVRLGPAAEIVDLDGFPTDLRADTARRILAVYR